MSEMNAVTTIQNYGKVHVRLREHLEEKNLTRYRLAQLAKTRFEVINKWYHDDVQKLDLDVLARICYVLGCDTSDLLYYSNESEK